MANKEKVEKEEKYKVEVSKYFNDENLIASVSNYATPCPICGYVSAVAEVNRKYQYNLNGYKWNGIIVVIECDSCDRHFKTIQEWDNSGRSTEDNQ